jgi:hypothetical protein
MMRLLVLAVVTMGSLYSGVAAAEHDYYKNLRYPTKLDPSVGRDTVDQEGGANAMGYHRRTAQWWPRKGQDIVDIPEGVPLRTWTRNQGQNDPEYQAGLCRNWTASDGETFKAHLIGFRGFGVKTHDPCHDFTLAPTAILRMENGEQRGVNVYQPFSMMLSEEDHAFILKIWEQEYKKITAAVSPLKYDGPNPWHDPKMTVEVKSDHFLIRSPGETEHKNLWWVRPHEPEKEAQYRQGSIEFAENMWSHIEVAGSTMPYWRCGGTPTRYVITVQLAVSGNLGGGGYAHCGLRDNAGGPRNIGLAHEFYHGHPTGGWDLWCFGETFCNQGEHFNLPGEMLMFSSNFAHPWRNVNCAQYQSGLLYMALGDSPHWGYGAASVVASLASAAEQTPYHTIARLGQKRGLWPNGVKGFGDFFGEYAARMVTCDFVLQYPLRSKYGMPTLSSLEPVYGGEGRYRIPNAEAPRTYGFNIVRLVPEAGAAEITVDFQGLYEPTQYSDWRASVVAVDAQGRARYSPQWNKGTMTLTLKPEDKHFWLVVAATPSAMPLSETNWADGKVSRPVMESNLMGVHTHRYPWEVTLTGCRPGSPHRRQGDVVNYDEIYSVNNGNRFTDYPVRHEVPTPLADKDGPLVQDKLADLARRLAASGKAYHDKRKKTPSGEYDQTLWWQHRKIEILGDMVRRVKFLQHNAKGHRHPNGGGFVSDNARVAATAYVGPNAMVLDGARVEGNACIKGYAVVLGEKTIVRGNAKVGGKAWVCGDLVIEGNARILESATVITTWRERELRADGRATISGNAVIKGEHVLKLCYTDDQTITGGVVMDYTPGVDGTIYYHVPGYRSLTTMVPGIENHDSGVFDCGRIYGDQKLADGKDAGALYVNWQFNQPKTTMLEDSYVNNNGVLRGGPTFAQEDGGECRFIVFNGKDQYAEAPAAIADFGELTIDVMLSRVAGRGGRVFDFGTGDDECFHLTIDGTSGKPTLTAKHDGKTYTLAAPAGIPANRWARVRVTMDGATAAIYVDGKQVAQNAFAFCPRSVFTGDRVEGNFLACSRNKDDFFAGRMDHVRIYRDVHKDFEALGSAPFAITQLQEWSEPDQQKADAWEAKKNIVNTHLMAGKYGELQKEIEQCQQEQYQLRRKQYNLDALEARARKADEAIGQMQREIDQAYRAHTDVAKIEEAIKRLNEKANVIANSIKENAEYVKLAEQVQAHEKKMPEVDAQVRAMPQYEAVAAKIQAANQARESAQKRINNLPQLTGLSAQIAKESDGQKKQKLQEQCNRLSQQLLAGDLQYQQACVANSRLDRVFNNMLRYKVRAELRKLESQGNAIRISRDTLHATLAAAHPDHANLQEEMAAKHKRLDDIRTNIQQRIQSKDVYKNAEQERQVARKAFDDASQACRNPVREDYRNKDVARLDARIAKMRQEANRLRDAAFKAAQILGDNPYPGAEAAELWDHQQNLTYHTTADWDTRTREEIEDRVTPTFKNWLLRVRGY